MLKNENIICISSIDWDFIWQGHQEIMSTFAKNGNRVLFIENTGVRTPTLKDIPRLKKRVVHWLKSVKGFRKEADNLYVYSPIVLPFPYSKIARWVNRKLLLDPLKKWVKAMGFRDAIIWTFLPTGIALDIIDELDKKALVYYFIADFDVLTDKPKKLKQAEEALIRACDVIFAQGKALQDKCKNINQNVHIFPFGVNTKVFDDFLNSSMKEMPRDLGDVKRPIIGYVGGIHKHVDLSLIRSLAVEHPEWSIVLVGPIQTDVSLVGGLPNVMFLGKKEFTELPSYIHQFDVCIIPYLLSDYTKTVYPTKLNEYHIMGKPVVSTDLPEVRAFNDMNGNLVALAGTSEEFAALVKKGLEERDTKKAAKRMEVAKCNTWSERIEGMSALIEQAIAGKKSSPHNWQENFLHLYKKTRKTASRLIGAAFLLLAVVFYTPLVWIVAEPLKIAQAPQKSDAVVVFAGGVGESGKASQGYEERVKYAVELHKDNYASKIIFSSGYMSTYKEPLLMEALALVLGVPKQDIILEAAAKSTYDNVLFTKRILDRNNWKNIILVSSPYNMRRVSLVAHKVAPELHIIYAPVPNSSFYGHSSVWGHQMADMKQVKGIIHEYLGIVFYKIKGYI